jgi:hypothetical protein
MKEFGDRARFVTRAPTSIYGPVHGLPGVSGVPLPPGEACLRKPVSGRRLIVPNLWPRQIDKTDLVGWNRVAGSTRGAPYHLRENPRRMGTRRVEPRSGFHRSGSTVRVPPIMLRNKRSGCFLAEPRCVPPYAAPATKSANQGQTTIYTQPGPGRGNHGVWKWWSVPYSASLPYSDSSVVSNLSSLAKKVRWSM